MQLDIDFVRAQFPAFAQPSLDGWAFFENAGGSYPCRHVVDRLTRFYTERKVQPYAPYPASTLGGQEMDEARDRLSAILNIGADEIHFGPSTSQNTYVLSHAARAIMDEGDEIIVTNQDHEANSGAWRRLAETGVTVREWTVDPETGHLNPGDLDNLLTDRTRLIAFPHCSNIVAEINPVRDICARARAAGAITVVDGVSYAPHGLPDVAGLGADIYMFSTYKTFGPHQGIMAVRRDVAERLANQGHWFNAGSLTKRLTPAGPDHAQIAACAGMADYVDALHNHHFDGEADAAERGRRCHDLARAHEMVLAQPLLDYLRERNDVRLLGPTDAASRAPTVAIAHAKPGEALAADLVQHRIMAGGGDFYATRLIDAMGVGADHGALRLSFVHYTRAEEVDQLITALDAVL